jgi:hypothetical protein
MSNAHREFLEELRRSFEMMKDSRNTLERKANSIMAISGTVAALIFGFGALFLKNVHPSYEYFNLFVFSLFFDIILSISAMVLCAWSFRLEYSAIPLGQENWSLDFSNGHPDDTFVPRLIRHYTEAIQTDDTNNKRKSKFISIGLLLFIFSLIVILILLYFVYNAVILNAITFPIKA